MRYHTWSIFGCHYEELNNDFFSNIKDSQGRLRCVLLIRPDIFQSLGLQNKNTKIRDNSVLLDWRTSYRNHRNSKLFEVCDRLLRSQQPDDLSYGQAWDFYFPDNAPNVQEKFTNPSSFISFLRLSLYRPRDIITMLSILQGIAKREDDHDKMYFTYKDTDSFEFRNDYSEYLLGEIKDHLLFYYSNENYELFLKFFEFLKGEYQFSYNTYLDAYSDMVDYISSIEHETPNFMYTAQQFPEGF